MGICTNLTHRYERIRILAADPAFAAHWAVGHIGKEYDADYCADTKQYRIPHCALEGLKHGNCHSHGGAYISAKYVTVVGACAADFHVFT